MAMEEDIAQELAALAKALAGDGDSENDAKEATEGESKEASRRVRLTHRESREKIASRREKLVDVRKGLRSVVAALRKEIKNIDETLERMKQE